MPGEGLANGIAPLDSTAKVPAVFTQDVEDLQTSLPVGSTFVSDGAGGIQGLIATGSYYSQVEDNVTDTTTTGPVTFLTLDTDLEDGDVPAGRYRITWHYVWQTDGATNEILVVVNMIAPGEGPNVLLNNPGGPKQAGAYEPQDSGNEHEVSGYRNVPLNAGRQVIVLTFAQGAGAGTVSIHRGAIELIRVPDP